MRSANYNLTFQRHNNTQGLCCSALVFGAGIARSYKTEHLFKWIWGCGSYQYAYPILHNFTFMPFFFSNTNKQGTVPGGVSHYMDMHHVLHRMKQILEVNPRANDIDSCKEIEKLILQRYEL